MNRHQKTTLARIICAAIVAGIAYIPAIPPQLPVWLFAIAYLIVAADVIFNALRNIAHGEIFDENFLMLLASGGAFAIGEYPEAVAVMLFYQIGELFQDVAVDRSRKSISSLMDIRPDYANLLKENGEMLKTDPSKVKKGELIAVKPGEKIPLDGVVTEGESALDTSALTGESMPRDVAPGSEVLAGTVNISGLLKIRTTAPYGESTVARILDLVENAESGKAKTERFITRFAKYYTPAVVAAAVLLAVLPPLITGGEWLMWLHRALIFLVVSCPCALVVSIPLSFFAGIGGASRDGILIKGSNYVEYLAALKTVVFDKTGTLTKGKFEVSEIHPEDGFSRERLLKAAAYAEKFSTHPVAVSLRNAYGEKIPDNAVSDVTDFSGEGLKAIVDGETVYTGNARLMKRIGIDAAIPQAPGTLVFVAIDGKYAGYIIISDTIKENSAKAVQLLLGEGINDIVMLTGDRLEAARQIAEAAGITSVRHDLLPADKAAIVKEIIDKEKKGEYTAFVGDGINDAPVLKTADVGIAMGGAGSDAAIEAADVVLMDDDPIKVPKAVSRAHRTLSIARQNIIFAIGVKFGVLILGAIGVANMWGAVFADVGVTIIAVLNALRAFRK